MANTYYKILNKNITNNFSDTLIGEVQRDLYQSVRKLNMNLYDEISKTKNPDDIDINTLLKFYAINQILKENQETKKESFGNNKYKNFEQTANPRIKRNTEDNKYYRFQYDEYILDSEIIGVYDDGTYFKEKRISFSSYTKRTIYNTKDIMIGIQLIDPNNVLLSNKHLIVEILGMRKEFVQKFKYSGFSGNSQDIIAAIGNKICLPIESGYYIDKKMHFYRWSDSQKMFVRNTKLELLSPLLTDYIFENNGKVIRKEYRGVV